MTILHPATTVLVSPESPKRGSIHLDFALPLWYVMKLLRCQQHSTASFPAHRDLFLSPPSPSRPTSSSPRPPSDDLAAALPAAFHQPHKREHPSQLALRQTEACKHLGRSCPPTSPSQLSTFQRTACYPLQLLPCQWRYAIACGSCPTSASAYHPFATAASLLAHDSYLPLYHGRLLLSCARVSCTSRPSPTSEKLLHTSVDLLSPVSSINPHLNSFSFFDNGLPVCKTLEVLLKIFQDFLVLGGRRKKERKKKRKKERKKERVRVFVRQELGKHKAAEQLCHHLWEPIREPMGGVHMMKSQMRHWAPQDVRLILKLQFKFLTIQGFYLTFLQFYDPSVLLFKFSASCFVVSTRKQGVHRKYSHIFTGFDTTSLYLPTYHALVSKIEGYIISIAHYVSAWD